MGKKGKSEEGEEQHKEEAEQKKQGDLAEEAKKVHEKQDEEEKVLEEDMETDQDQEGVKEHEEGQMSPDGVNSEGKGEDQEKKPQEDQQEVVTEVVSDAVGEDAGGEQTETVVEQEVVTGEVVHEETVTEEDVTSSVTKTVIVKAEDADEVTTEETATIDASSGNGANVAAEEQTVQGGQQIYIIQTTDGTIPMETAEVVVADDMAVYETVSALEQLSRGNVVTTATTGEGGEIIQVYEEVILPGDGSSGGIIDQFVDVAEVEVGDGRSASPIKIETTTGRKRKSNASSASRASTSGTVSTTSTTNHIVSVGGGNAGPEFHICRLCNQIIPPNEIATHNQEHHGSLGELTCSDCGKVFKSKRSLFGHRKEKHSGITEVHHCPECGKSFGRKSNLKAHRESLHYGKKFPCAYCERIFTNRSSMNQHIKKTHTVPEVGTSFIIQQE